MNHALLLYRSLPRNSIIPRSIFLHSHIDCQTANVLAQGRCPIETSYPSDKPLPVIKGLLQSLTDVASTHNHLQRLLSTSIGRLFGVALFFPSPQHESALPLRAVTMSISPLQSSNSVEQHSIHVSIILTKDGVFSIQPSSHSSNRE